MAVVIKVGLTSRDDGPSGFGEFVVKGALMWLAAGAFLVVSLWRPHPPDGRPASVARRASRWLASAVLSLCAGVLVADACSDGGGHCRHWQLYSGPPISRVAPA